MSFLGELWDNTAGGLLWKPLKKATGLTDAQMIGLSGAAVAAPFALPAMGGGGAAGGLLGGSPMSLATSVNPASMTAMNGLGVGAGAAPASGGLLSTISAYAKPAGDALGAASAAKSLIDGAQQPVSAAPSQARPLDLSGVLVPQAQLEQLRMQDDMKRRLSGQQAAQGLLGGGYGRSA